MQREEHGHLQVLEAFCWGVLFLDSKTANHVVDIQSVVTYHICAAVILVQLLSYMQTDGPALCVVTSWMFVEWDSGWFYNSDALNENKNIKNNWSCFLCLWGSKADTGCFSFCDASNHRYSKVMTCAVEWVGVSYCSRLINIDKLWVAFALKKKLQIPPGQRDSKCPWSIRVQPCPLCLPFKGCATLLFFAWHRKCTLRHYSLLHLNLNSHLCWWSTRGNCTGALCSPTLWLTNYWSQCEWGI
jgi:hypothetical protein